MLSLKKSGYKSKPNDERINIYTDWIDDFWTDVMVGLLIFCNTIFQILVTLLDTSVPITLIYIPQQYSEKKIKHASDSQCE